MPHGVAHWMSTVLNSGRTVLLFCNLHRLCVLQLYNCRVAVSTQRDHSNHCGITLLLTPVSCRFLPISSGVRFRRTLQRCRKHLRQKSETKTVFCGDLIALLRLITFRMPTSCGVCVRRRQVHCRKALRNDRT